MAIQSTKDNAMILSAMLRCCLDELIYKRYEMIKAPITICQEKSAQYLTPYPLSQIEKIIIAGAIMHPAAMHMEHFLFFWDILYALPDIK